MGMTAPSISVDRPKTIVVTGGSGHVGGNLVRALREHRDVRCEKAGGELDWAPRPLEETIADTLAWYRKTGAL